MPRNMAYSAVQMVSCERRTGSGIDPQCERNLLGTQAAAQVLDGFEESALARR